MPRSNLEWVAPPIDRAVEGGDAVLAEDWEALCTFVEYVHSVAIPPTFCIYQVGGMHPVVASTSLFYSPRTTGRMARAVVEERDGKPVLFGTAESLTTARRLGPVTSTPRAASGSPFTGQVTESNNPFIRWESWPS